MLLNIGGLVFFPFFPHGMISYVFPDNGNVFIVILNCYKIDNFFF